METPTEEIPIQIKLLNAMMDVEILTRKLADAEKRIDKLVKAGDELEQAMHSTDLLAKIEPQGKWFLAKHS